ncbi:MAG: MgtC/SapB family protein, partial [Sulfuricaulis sp.]|uniref:MgtC/SapB family protein n=1 Tax=Sulfuricaulis sp. TaxID=2003553 RepID=UPI003C69A20E
MPEVDVVVVRNFLIALLIGALVGIEREKHKVTEHPESFGGLRTFILFAQAGAVGAWLSQHIGTPWVFIATLTAVAAAVVTAYVLESRVKPDALGLTTEISAITVCLLGGAVMYGYAELAVALAILTSAVLTFKQPLHGVVQKLGTDDLYAGLKLLIATFIVLPLLPAQPIDPLQALNPYKLWLLVILISGMSLVGYVAVRWLGTARGTAITGLSGGLVSSTAVSL